MRRSLIALFTSLRGLRSAASRPKPARRQILVLTPEEKKAICFVLIAFVLGLATKHYRDTHPRPPKAEVKAVGKVSSHPGSRQTRISRKPQPSAIQDN